MVAGWALPESRRADERRAVDRDDRPANATASTAADPAPVPAPAVDDDREHVDREHRAAPATTSMAVDPASAATVPVPAPAIDDSDHVNRPGGGNSDGGGGDGGDGGRNGSAEGRPLAVLRAGLAEVRGAASVRRALMLIAVLTVIPALDEYVPLLAQATGAGATAVPLLVLVVAVGTAAGGWLAGRGGHLLAPALAVAALLVVVGAGSGRAVGIVGVATAFGIFYWALALADARLQERIDERSRATVTSIAGVGMEAVAIVTFAGYAAGSMWLSPGLLFACAAVPFLPLALTLLVRRARGSRHNAQPVAEPDR
jgi:hypothetical protein